jgi:hypothetical protein
MLERIVVRPQKGQSDCTPLDVGATVEAMLFYG